VSAYPDTSFLCALYVPQTSSPAAIEHYRGMREPLRVSSLLLYEFRQSVRFQVFRHEKDSSHGYGRRFGSEALARLQSNLASGALALAPVEWTEVINFAEGISARNTMTLGCRFADVLHVATAVYLGATSFLSFDANQRKLASAEGLAAGP
jgi:predicted nucleic acid-binding protein